MGNNTTRGGETFREYSPEGQGWGQWSRRTAACPDRTVGECAEIAKSLAKTSLRSMSSFEGVCGCVKWHASDANGRSERPGDAVGEEGIGEHVGHDSWFAVLDRAAAALCADLHIANAEDVLRGKVVNDVGTKNGTVDDEQRCALALAISQVTPNIRARYASVMFGSLAVGEWIGAAAVSGA